jgi:hypothetical protein
MRSPPTHLIPLGPDLARIRPAPHRPRAKSRYLSALGRKAGNPPQRRRATPITYTNGGRPPGYRLVDLPKSNRIKRIRHDWPRLEALGPTVAVKFPGVGLPAHPDVEITRIAPNGAYPKPGHPARRARSQFIDRARYALSPLVPYAAGCRVLKFTNWGCSGPDGGHQLDGRRSGKRFRIF